MTNCKNCGAPFTGKSKCEWCGTIYPTQINQLQLESEIDRLRLSIDMTEQTASIIRSMREAQMKAASTMHFSLSSAPPVCRFYDVL